MRRWYGREGQLADGPQPSLVFDRQTVSEFMAAPTPTPTDETELRPPDPSPEPKRTGHFANNLPAVQPGEPLNPDAPLSFVPHLPLEQTERPQPLRIRTGRHGELDEHELIRLLDSIEDERARSRFRESVYISIFVWMAIALLALFGPRYLWHAPRLVLPSEVLRARELTTLTAPTLSVPHVNAAPDSHTLEHLRSTEPRTPAPRPAAPASREEPRPTPTPPSPSGLKIAPATAPPNLPMSSAPEPQPMARRPTPPVVADAPTPQPSTRPNFNTGPASASDMIENAVHTARSGGNGGVGIRSNSRNGDVGMGPAEVLSDTKGVNFDPYLQRILREIYDQWIPLIPEEARPPLSKSGTTLIRFIINPDGSIGGVYLDGSTHDSALNKAAWGSITGVGQFPPLPSQFTGPNLELRIHYLVNEKTE